MTSSCAPSMTSLGDVDLAKNYDFAKKKYGREGKELPIYANFFPLTSNCPIIYHYNIDIQVQDLIIEKGDRNVPQRNKLMQQKKLYNDSNFAVFERFVKQETGLFSSEPVYDGKSNVYSKTRINLKEKSLFQVKQKVPEKKFPVTFNITMTIPKDSNELDMTILNDPNVKNAEKEIQALDVILQYGPKKYKLAVGSNFFLRKQDLASTNNNARSKRFDLGEIKEISFGHYQSVKLTERGTQLNLDRAAIVLYKGGKLINLIEQLCTEFRAGPQKKNAPPVRRVEIDRNFKLNKKELALINAELKGLSFEVNHISYKPKNKIFCITDQPVSQIFFDQKTRDSDETVRVSVKDYFERLYSDYLDKQGGGGLLGNLPCVQIGKTNPKFFPMEVVSILEDQYMTKKLKPKHQSDMTRFCGQQKPSDRFKEGIDQVKTLISTRDDQMDYLKYFNIDLNPKYTEAKGRVLNPPTLLFDKKKSTAKDGQWRPESYVIPAADVRSNWMLINYTEDNGNQIRYAPKKDQIDDFINTLLDQSSRFGVQLERPCDIIYNEKYEGRLDLEEAISYYLSQHKDLKLLIFVIPKSDELYSNIKFFTEIRVGVVSQCVSQEKSRQFVTPNYVSNLLLKINAKLGGSNAHLDASCKVGHLKKKTMIMGLDVTHPNKRDRLGNSIASVVSTFDSKMVNYYSKCVVQPKPRLEIVLLDEICKEMLEKFKSANGFYPDFILLYRDGVSEGQFPVVVEKEINLIKKACSQISENYKPKLTFLVVQKRHHARFLPVNERDRNPNSQNVLPGTIIDNTIVSNYYFDFYLISHHGALGTSRPTRYVVLHDESEFSGDEIQKTTNLLCYLFPRCSRSVSVPPAVLFAHLAAKRARSYLFTLDNNRGQVYGEAELTPSEIKDLNARIEVKENLRNILYYV